MQQLHKSYNDIKTISHIQHSVPTVEYFEKSENTQKNILHAVAYAGFKKKGGGGQELQKI